MAYSELRSKLLSRPTKTKESLVRETEVTTVMSTKSEASIVLNTSGNEEPEELAEEIDEEDFRAKYKPGDRGAKMAINFISTQKDSH